MRLDLTDDEVALRDAFRTFFAAEATPESARAHAAVGFDASLWAAACELGLPAMGLSEAAGGGADLAQLAVVATEVGRTIASIPFVEHTAAARLLEGTGADVAALAGGEAIATLALRPPRDGVARVLPAGAVAHVVVALDGDRLLCVTGEPPMAALRNHGDAPVADRSLAGAATLASGTEAVAAYRRARLEWFALMSAVQIGIAQTALELAQRYVMERHQFGVPIGSFQAVQHGLADIPGQILGAEMLTGKACWAGDLEAATGQRGTVDIGDNVVDDFAALAPMAFLHAAESAAWATDRSLHFHGGYGYSEEYDIQLHYRRARAWAQVAGDPARLFRELADVCFGPAPAPPASSRRAS